MYFVADWKGLIVLGRPFIDISGERFGKLIAIEYTGKDKKSKYFYRIWMCKCDCGETKSVTYRDLVRGSVKSCGCIAYSGLIAGGKNKLDLGEARFHDLYLSYNRSAKSRKHIFKLTREQFRVLTKANCYYCGVLPSQVIKASNGVNGDYVYNGIDRIDSSIGYIIDNCRSCCKKCNTAKNTMSEQDFYLWIERIYTHLRLHVVRNLSMGNTATKEEK